MTQKSAVSNMRCPALFTTVFLPFLMVCFTALFAGARLHAQAVNGINGTVTDLSGAIIVGANVTVTNDATGVTAKAVSSSAGTFTLVGLSPGDYSVVVDAPGFKTVKTTLTVEVAKMSSTSFQMSPGATTETVQVKEADVLLNTTSPDYRYNPGAGVD